MPITGVNDDHCEPLKRLDFRNESLLSPTDQESLILLMIITGVRADVIAAPSDLPLLNMGAASKSDFPGFVNQRLPRFDGLFWENGHWTGST